MLHAEFIHFIELLDQEVLLLVEVGYLIGLFDDQLCLLLVDVQLLLIGYISCLKLLLESLVLKAHVVCDQCFLRHD